MFDKSIDSQLDNLKGYIEQMGANVEKALLICSKGMQERDLSALAEVHQIEETINEYHVRVDSASTMIIAKLGPVAKDLRLILSIIKMNADLERMGDQCANIAYLAKDIISRKEMVSFNEINTMIVSVVKMVRLSLECFVKLDAKLAEEVLKMDDEVDAFKGKIRNQCVAQITSNPDQTESLLDLIFISRNLERLGDHATNVAEDVIYALSGKDIRHGQSEY